MVPTMSNESKSKAELLREELLRSQKHACEVLSEEELAQADAFCEGYKVFLDACKTERESADFLLEKATGLGFAPFEEGKRYPPGAKLFVNNRGKSVILAVLGTAPLEEGLRLAAAHTDSPRLDLKPAPLYEERALALAKTHYYGGIKKYQWAAIPLALHGVAVRKDGSTVRIRLGEAPG
ncbi:MAG: aminopeptidase, partial [Oscillospiraceae bacterium]|nr:aminopeptidase [Oscillospiraceae bacterium]